MNRFCLLALLPIALAGCKHVASRAECVDHGGVAWREVTSPHFRITTNLDAKSAREALTELEKSRQALLFAFGGTERHDPPGRLEAIILQSDEQMSEFAHEDTAGFMLRDERGPIIVLGGESYAFNASPDRQLVNHELAHYLSSYVLHRQPRWLAEGLAGYLEVTRPYGPNGEEVRMGEVNTNLLLWNRTHARIPLEDLWKWQGDEDLRQSDRVSYYATSWLWVHFLLNRYDKPFADFQGRLARAEEPREAWRHAFELESEELMLLELNRYLDQGRYNAFRFPFPKVPGGSSERMLTSAEVHGVRARVMMLGAKPMDDKDRVKAIAAELATANTLDPDDFESNFLRSLAGDGAARIERARALTRKHPDKSWAWLALAWALGSDTDQPRERRQALVQAVQVDPENPHALNTLAWDYATHGQPKVALPLAQKAVKLAPWSASIVDTYAAALAGAGRCAEAVSAELRAIDMLHERASEEERGDYEARLKDYKGGCKPKEAAASSN
jgi:tetratricopeptide (TPR) repeat protein